MGKKKKQQLVKLAATDRRWIQVMTDGLVRHPRAPNRSFKVNANFIGYLNNYLADMRKQNFYPPICANHVSPPGLIPSEAHEDSDEYGAVAYRDALVHGRVLKIERRGEDQTWFLVEWAKYAAKDFDEGRIENFSPTFIWGWTDPTTDITYPVIIKELSFLQHKHLKNVPSASPHYAVAALAESFVGMAHVRMQEATIMANNDTTPTESVTPPAAAPEEAPAWFKEFSEANTKRLDGIEARFTETPKVEPPAAPEGETEIEALNRRLSATEAKLALSEAARKVSMEHPGISPESAVMLGEVRLNLGEEKYKKLAETFAKEATPKKTTEGSTTVLLGETGFGGNGDPKPIIDYDQAVKLGEEAGHTNGTKEMADYLSKNHPELA